jgi:ribonuclease HI
MEEQQAFMGFEKPKFGWVVDGATEGKTGLSEYRGVDLQTNKVVFHQKIGVATNNITEFLAVVHAIAEQKKRGISIPIYTDSVTALSWVKSKKCNTSLKPGRYTKLAIDMQERAEKYLKTIELDLSESDVIKHNGIEIMKWYTSSWGEIPADFSRKINRYNSK